MIFLPQLQVSLVTVFIVPFNNRVSEDQMPVISLPFASQAFVNAFRVIRAMESTVEQVKRREFTEKFE